jgi:uroporphyrinogen III methyltransferase / synthase
VTTDQLLVGRTVLVTRGRAKGDLLGELLGVAGATVLRVPLIAVEPLAEADTLAGAVQRLRTGESGAWLVLTSQTAVNLLIDRVGEAAALDGVSVAVVGPATEAALRSHGIEAALVASGQTAQSLADELATRHLERSNVLIVAAAGGGDVVAPALRAGGACVEVIAAYRSVLPPGAAAQLRSTLAETSPDAVIFTSGSTVANFTRCLPSGSLPPCPAVCIGPVTAAAARDAGWVTVVTADEHTAHGLLAATVQVLCAERLP